MGLKLEGAGPFFPNEIKISLAKELGDPRNPLSKFILERLSGRTRQLLSEFGADSDSNHLKKALAVKCYVKSAVSRL